MIISFVFDRMGMHTEPPATTGTKALPSQPLTLKLYSKNEVKSFSFVNVCLIALVKARPAAWPTRRNWTTSSSLLNALISLTIGRSGFTFRMSTSFLSFSEAPIGPYRYRCRDERPELKAGISV